MPELPEVETTRRGLQPHLCQQSVLQVIVRNSRLRWPIPAELSRDLPGQVITDVWRRGKYLLLSCPDGTLMIHLGMSGSLRVLAAETPPQKHDHVDIVLHNGQCLRYHDPRRFGCVLWTQDADVMHQHPLLATLGPEPLSDDFHGRYLYQKSRNRRSSIKSFIMDSHIVVGVGNIYASESLFLAGIDPRHAAGQISQARYETLAGSIQTVLEQAIAAGGTTLRDFTNSEGNPGYFKQSLTVYERAGANCVQCGGMIQQIVLHHRSTYFCANCQT